MYSFRSAKVNFTFVVYSYYSGRSQGCCRSENQHGLYTAKIHKFSRLIYIYIIIKVARLSVKSSMKTQSIKLNYKSHKRDFIKTSTVCFAFSAHQEVILNADIKLRKNARKKKNARKFYFN